MLTDNQYKEMQKRLQMQVKLGEDSVRFYPLSRHTLLQVEVWGEPPITSAPSSIIV
ncbi:CRISPR-associated endonuclease Cas2 [Scytonema sp. NUACC26]|uniref:CRISPR-associated endonuclease Cas2 n=1 Tax=Scytonema sp. NUACC26 TaxID=3140176 RepID=UPI0038B244DE